MKTIVNDKQIDLIIQRLAHQIIENNALSDNMVVIGLQPRGVWLSNRIHKVLEQLYNIKVAYGQLDITFYRDDIRNELHVPNKTNIDFSIENKTVILIDDVLFTGRTIRAAMDALLDFGRPKKVELCVFINRRFSRELPIQPHYTGKVIDSFESQKVKVFWNEKDGRDEVVLI